MHSLELHDLIIDCCRPTIFKEEDELYSLMEVHRRRSFILLEQKKEAYCNKGMYTSFGVT